METKPMPPSLIKDPMTDEIDRAVARFRATLEKHGKHFDSKAVQTVLGQKEFTREMACMFRRRVEAQSTMFVRSVHVDRNKTLSLLARSGGFKLFVTSGALEMVPKRSAPEVEVHFFYIKRSVTDGGLRDEYRMRGLAADPLAQLTAQITDPPTATQYHSSLWGGPDGEMYSITIRHDEKSVDVQCDRHHNTWSAGWWFAGVPIETSE